jgi:hypothetical protein
MSSLGTFSLDLSKFATKAMGNADKVVKKACFDIGSDIQKATPKDTGRAKTGWQWQVGSITAFKPPPGTYASPPAPMVPGFALGDTLYLANNVEYIKVLEDGWSRQAPAGMVKVTLTRWQNYVAAAVASL